ncbi:MAG: outer-membrane lipoprotein carrier protein LolA [Gemmatimonadetes bacterium]|nr:outer-membrane lipoprotein carrier protein LolA [Gemmatimonadota bacterium]
MEHRDSGLDAVPDRVEVNEDLNDMIVSVRHLGVCILIGATACSGSDERASDEPATADTVAASEVPEPGPADSAPALPPGLDMVVEDDPGRRTADRATGGTDPAGRLSPSADTPVRSPAGGGVQPSAPARDIPAEQQDDGADVLRRAGAAYGNVRSMQASFVMQFDNPLLRQQTTSRGTLYQQRPDRIALRFTDPDGDVILSDGQHFYVYQPSIDANQATQSPASPGGGGGVDLQAQFIGNPTERFRYTLHGRESVGGRPADVMTLTPRERAEYRSLKVWFDTRDALARRFEITEHNGSVRRFDLSGLRINTDIPPATFRFTPPASVRVVRVG